MASDFCKVLCTLNNFCSWRPIYFLFLSKGMTAINIKLTYAAAVCGGFFTIIFYLLALLLSPHNAFDSLQYGHKLQHMASSHRLSVWVGVIREIAQTRYNRAREQDCLQ